MHNQPHPGDFIEGVVLEPWALAMQDSHDLRQAGSDLIFQG